MIAWMTPQRMTQSFHHPRSGILLKLLYTVYDKKTDTRRTCTLLCFSPTLIVQIDLLLVPRYEACWLRAPPMYSQPNRTWANKYRK